MGMRQKNIISIPAAFGVDQSAAPLMSATGTFENVVNAVYEKDGRLSRRRSTALKTNTIAVAGHGGGGSIPKRISKLGRFAGVPVLLAHNRLYDYSAQYDKVSEHGFIPECGAPNKSQYVYDTTKSVWHGQHARAGKIRLSAWLWTTGASSTGELWAAIHTVDGVEIVRRQLVASNVHRVRVLSAGTYCILWWVEGAGAPYDLKWTRVDGSGTPTTIPNGTTHVAATLSSPIQFDAHSNGDAISFVTYYDGGNIVTDRLDGSMATTHTATDAHTASSALDIFTDGTNVVLGFSEPLPLTRYLVRSWATLASVLTVTTIDATVSYSVQWERGTGSGFYFVLGQTATTGPFSGRPRLKFGTVTTAGVVTLFARSCWHFTIASRLIKYDGVWYGVLAYTSSLLDFQSAYYLCALDDDDFPRPVCVLATGSTAATIQSGAGITNPAQGPISEISTGKYEVSLPENFAFSLTGSPGGAAWAFGQSGLTRWDFSFEGAYADQVSKLPVEFGKALYLTGGVLGSFDGAVFSEIGFTYPPDIDVINITHGVGGNSWNYVFTYVWRDAQGNFFESAPSVPKTVTAAALPATLNVQTQTLTYKQRDGDPQKHGTPIGIRVYRTLNAGTVYYYVTEAANDLTNAYVVITDGAGNTDAVIATHMPLFFDGIVSPGQTIAARALAVWDGRLVAADTPDAQITSRWRIDRAPYPVDDPTHEIHLPDQANVTALGVLDGVLVLFKGERIYLLDGDGPGEIGQPLLREPRVLTVDSGAEDQRGVVALPQGLAYVSKRGLMALPRGFGEPVFFGKRVQTCFPANAYVAQSVVVPERQLAIWTVPAGLTGLVPGVSSTVGTVLVYDYQRDVWTTWLWNDAHPSDLGVTAIDGTLYFSSTVNDGIWFSETAAPGQDLGATTYRMFLESNTWHPNGIGQWLRVRMLRIFCEELTSGAFDVQVFIDHDVPPIADMAYSFAAFTGIRDLDASFPVQPTPSVKFLMLESGSTITDGLVIYGFALELFQQQKLYPQPSTSRKG